MKEFKIYCTADVEWSIEANSFDEAIQKALSKGEYIDEDGLCILIDSPHRVLQQTDGSGNDVCIEREITYDVNGAKVVLPDEQILL